MPETRFDEWIAAHYATLWPELFDPALLVPTVDFLTTLAGGGPCLEFGAGTGRVAVPLSDHGLPVTGIELSPAMAEAAGLTLRERWADWHRTPFTPASPAHISVWTHSQTRA